VLAGRVLTGVRWWAWGVGLGAIGLAWRGVNHQRLPVDAIVIDYQVCVCVAMDGVNEWWC
jgi:hypothetical protein